MISLGFGQSGLAFGGKQDSDAEARIQVGADDACTDASGVGHVPTVPTEVVGASVPKTVLQNATRCPPLLGHRRLKNLTSKRGLVQIKLHAQPA